MNGAFAARVADVLKSATARRPSSVSVVVFCGVYLVRHCVRWLPRMRYSDDAVLVLLRNHGADDRFVLGRFEG